MPDDFEKDPLIYSEQDRTIRNLTNAQARAIRGS